MFTLSQKIQTLLANKKRLVAVTVILLALLMPFIISQVLKQQDVRQRASAAPPVTFQFKSETIEGGTPTAVVGQTVTVGILVDQNSNRVDASELTFVYDPTAVKLSIPQNPVYIDPLLKKEDANGTLKLTILSYTATAPTSGMGGYYKLDVTFLKAGSTTITLKKDMKVTAMGQNTYIPIANTEDMKVTFNAIDDCTSLTTNRPDYCYCQTNTECKSNSCVSRAGGPTPLPGKTTSDKICTPNNQTKTPLSLKTDYVSLTADDFAIKVNGTAFKTPTTFTRIASDPGADNGLYTTLEAEWKQGTTEMRMNMYFKYNGTFWYLDELRTYNGKTPGEWIYYATTDSQGNIVQHALTQTFINAGVTTFKPKDGTTENSISFENLHLQAFLKSNGPTPTKEEWCRLHPEDITTCKSISPTIAPTNPPVNVCNAAKYRSENCACTENSQCRSNTCTGGKCVVTPKDVVPTGATGLKLSVKIPGIGAKTTANDDNPQPKNNSRIARVVLTDSNNLQIAVNSDATKSALTALHFNPSTFAFEGPINLGTTIAGGNYLVKLALDNTLVKLVPGILSIVKGKPDNESAIISLVSGDLNEDNTLGISDWTNMIACLKNEPACSPDLKAVADLNDNGTVEKIDVHLLLRGFAVRNGD